jgi:hypothetical protein
LQIVYHLLFHANLYYSPSESGIRKWPKQRIDYHRFDKMHDMRRDNPDEIIPYSKVDLTEYAMFVLDQAPRYLSEMKPAGKCRPSGYDENQMEFQMNNLRPVQHHPGEIIERHDLKRELEYQWK